MEPCLLIRSGEETETRPLTGSAVTFGRSKSCDVVLCDSAVSSHHIKIARQGKVFLMRELDAKNGTFVNGERLRERVLQPGDEIRIGHTTIVFQTDAAEAIPSPTPPPARPAAPPAASPAKQVAAGIVLLEMLGSIPAYLFSGAVHALIFFLFMTVVVSTPDVPKERVYNLSLAKDGQRDLGEPLVAPNQKNDSDQDLFTAQRISDEPMAPEPDPLEKPADKFGKQDQPDEPLQVALAPDKLVVRVKSAPRSKPDSSDESSSTPLGGNLDLPPGDDVAGIVLGRLKDGRPGDFDALGSLKGENIIVITGVYDHVETVLDGLRVPHLTLTPKKYDRTKSDATCAILVDCPGFLNGTEIARIRKWVDKGGYLFTTDWALSTVEKLFPGTVRQGGRQTSEDWVAVGPVKGMEGHAFLKDVFSPLKGRPQWWLEEGSFPIQVVDPSKVQVLIDSAEMKKRYGEGAVAVTFEYGQGKVLHVCSHFHQVSTDAKTHYSMTQLIVNFLLEARKAQDGR